MSFTAVTWVTVPTESDFCSAFLALPAESNRPRS